MNEKLTSLMNGCATMHVVFWIVKEKTGRGGRKSQDDGDPCDNIDRRYNANHKKEASTTNPTFCVWIVSHQFVPSAVRVPRLLWVFAGKWG